MIKRGKKYLQAASLIEKNKLYSAQEACDLVRKTSVTKFDSSVDVSFSLNIDTRFSEQQIRGAIVLPNGTGKSKKVLAITTKIQEAIDAGADIAGGKDMIEKIQKENWFGFDVIVATPEMMGELGKIGKILGPKGLMPNPKVGTVSPDIAKAVKEIKAGKVEYRADKEGNVNVTIGRASFEADKLYENFKTIFDIINKAKPATVKGSFMKNLTITTTMGPSIKIDMNI